MRWWRGQDWGIEWWGAARRFMRHCHVPATRRGGRTRLRGRTRHWRSVGSCRHSAIAARASEDQEAIMSKHAASNATALAVSDGADLMVAAEQALGAYDPNTGA